MAIIPRHLVTKDRDRPNFDFDAKLNLGRSSSTISTELDVEKERHHWGAGPARSFTQLSFSLSLTVKEHLESQCVFRMGKKTKAVRRVFSFGPSEKTEGASTATNPIQLTHHDL